MSCENVEGPGISRLLRKFRSNKFLQLLLQACLIWDFDLLRNSDPNRPFVARIDIGIEPSDMAICFQLFSGVEFESEVVGILQLNALTRADLVTGPLTSDRMQIWRRYREEVNALGFSSDAVGLVEFVNDNHHSIVTPIHITKTALTFAQDAEPFEFNSTLFGISKVPFTAMTCLESVFSLVLFLVTHPDVLL